MAVQFELVHVYPAGIYFWDPAFFSGNPSIFPLGFTSGSRFFYGNPEILSQYIYIGIPLLLRESRNFIPVGSQLKSHNIPVGSQYISTGICIGIPGFWAGFPKFYPGGIRWDPTWNPIKIPAGIPVEFQIYFLLGIDYYCS